MVKAGVSQKIIDEFARISPIAWVYILFSGRYNFKKNNLNIDIERMALVLEGHVKQSFWKSD